MAKETRVRVPAGEPVNTNPEEEAPPKYEEQPIAPRVAELGDAGPKKDESSEDPEDGVLMMFPSAVNLQHEGIMHRFGKGIHRVKKSLVGHYYLKHCGVVTFKE